MKRDDLLILSQDLAAIRASIAVAASVDDVAAVLAAGMATQTEVDGIVTTLAGLDLDNRVTTLEGLVSGLDAEISALATAAAKQTFLFSQNRAPEGTDANTADTLWMHPAGIAIAGEYSSSVPLWIPITVGGKLHIMRMFSLNNPGGQHAGARTVYTAVVKRAGVDTDTPITCQVDNVVGNVDAGLKASDLAHDFVVQAGDLVAIRVDSFWHRGPDNSFLSLGFEP